VDHVKPGKKFRVFGGDSWKSDLVESITVPELAHRSRNGRFAYMETADSDPLYGRGHHLIDCLPPSHLRHWALNRGAQLNWSYFKTRAYVSLMHEEGEYIVEWHYDGYHQVILNVCGVDKTFELSPPPPGHLCDESGWLPAERYPKAAEAVVLRPGDVLFLPAGTLHRVVTRGLSMTINTGFRQINEL
jgi:hypothetical protein